MKAKDVMRRAVISMRPSATVREAASLLAEHGISAIPIVDGQEKLVGIVSEGDLLRRKEIGTKKRRSWWLELLTDTDTLAHDYAKAHSACVTDVMSSPVISVAEETPLVEIADILERRGIKRVTVLREGALVGIVSRADLVRALAESGSVSVSGRDDASIRSTLEQRIESQRWASTASLKFTVSKGVVELYGVVTSGEQHKAVRVLAETVPGSPWRTISSRCVKSPPAYSERIHHNAASAHEARARPHAGVSRGQLTARVRVCRAPGPIWRTRSCRLENQPPCLHRCALLG